MLLKYSWDSSVSTVTYVTESKTVFVKNKKTPPTHSQFVMGEIRRTWVPGRPWNGGCVGGIGSRRKRGEGRIFVSVSGKEEEAPLTRSQRYVTFISVVV